MKLRRSVSAGERAARLLPKLLADYLSAGRKLADGAPSPKELHKFRIATKKFRYSVELFLPIFGKQLDRELDPMREIQRLLGKLHDYHIIGSMLGSDHGLQAKLRLSTKEKLKAFHKEWAAFDSTRKIRRWKEFLRAGSSKSGPDYSKRKARIGSTEAARRAGTRFATKPTKATPKTTAE